GAIIEGADDLELLAPVSVSTVNFRYVPVGSSLSAEELDTLNQRISDRIVESGEGHVPTTKVNGAVSIRACVLHYENSEDDADHLIELVRKFAT
ncbi:MAG: hypothetical protein HOA60_12485, partial [Rhodospirillales bacterium]|nr:hypothetical protein [Rhodospirillales bacterium]